MIEIYFEPTIGGRLIPNQGFLRYDNVAVGNWRGTGAQDDFSVVFKIESG
jgi:hypothetical protein